MADTEPARILPHGGQQQVKMEIAGMIHGGESPYDIIYHVAQWLEHTSGEPGYAAYIEEQMRAVYGLALMHVRPMEDELRDVEERLSRIRIAMDLHKKNIVRLKELIARAKADGASTDFVKN